ncbi:hypothetical protein [Streptomyces sp. NBC_01210]
MGDRVRREFRHDLGRGVREVTAVRDSPAVELIVGQLTGEACAAAA